MTLQLYFTSLLWIYFYIFSIFRQHWVYWLFDRFRHFFSHHLRQNWLDKICLLVSLTQTSGMSEKKIKKKRERLFFVEHNLTTSEKFINQKIYWSWEPLKIVRRIHNEESSLPIFLFPFALVYHPFHGPCDMQLWFSQGCVPSCMILHFDSVYKVNELMESGLNSIKHVLKCFRNHWKRNHYMHYLM